MLVDQIEHHLDTFRLESVIAVHEHYIFALNQRKRCISGAGKSAVWLVDHMDPAVLFLCPVADCTTLIFGAIIYQKNLDIPAGLLKQTVDTAFEIFLDVVNRYDNGNQVSFPFPIILFLKQVVFDAAKRFERTFEIIRIAQSHPQTVHDVARTEIIALSCPVTKFHHLLR